MHQTTTAAFTLLELLVTISVIATLTTIAVPSFLQSRTKAYDAKSAVYARTLTMWIATADDGTNSVSGITDCLAPVLVAQGAPAALPEYVSACAIANTNGHLIVTVQSTNGREFNAMY